MSEADQRDPQADAKPDMFPETLWSTVWKAAAEDPEKAAEAVGRLCVRYSHPIYVWLRRAGHNHEAAEDARQGFIEKLLARARLPEMDPARGRFRAWLLTALRNFMNDQYDARVAAKRGGHAEHVAVESECLPVPPEDVDAALDCDLARIVHERSLEAVRSEWLKKGQQTRFEVLSPFVRSDPPPGAYVEAADRIGIDAAKVKRAVFDLRTFYAQAYRAEVATFTDPSELAAEMAYLLSCPLPPPPPN